MATFQVKVAPTPGRDFTPYALAPERNGRCETLRTAVIPVPSGQSRHLTYTYGGASNGQSGQLLVTETITADATRVLLLDGIEDLDIPENNIIWSVAYLDVRLTASDPIFWNTGIARYSIVDPGNPEQTLRC